MTKKPLTETQRLRRINLRLLTTVFILGLIIAALAVIYIYNHSEVRTANFGKVNKDSIALPHIRNYRKGLHLERRSMGVFYDTNTISKYIDSTFIVLMNTQRAWQASRNWADSSKYRWVVGFYWMKKKDSSTAGSANKMDFYVIPTLVQIAPPHHVLDYYLDTDSIYYHGKSTKSGKSLLTTPDDGSAYDEGQLWP